MKIVAYEVPTDWYSTESTWVARRAGFSGWLRSFFLREVVYSNSKKNAVDVFISKFKKQEIDQRKYFYDENGKQVGEYNPRNNLIPVGSYEV